MTKAELIKKFLDNSCTDDEARLLMQYMEAEPLLLDEMLSKSEWDEIDNAVPITSGIEVEMRKHVVSRTMKPVFRIAKSALRAAAVVSAVAFGLIVLHNATKKTSVGDQLAGYTETSATREKISNSTLANKHITLADNSTVTLFPGSTVEYDLAFRERSITLNGKAIFSVTKNTASKFVVHSGAITTTALGTRFLVDYSNDVNKINVQLFEGKVVVEPADESSIIGETYLAAGEQCFVDLNRMLVKVKPLFTPTVVVHRKSSPVDKNKHGLAPANASGSLNFSQTPLHEVLENLRLVYKQPIIFKAEDIRGRHFTGSFTNHDSLSTILRMISMMNELDVVMEKGAFKVVKATPGDEGDNNQRNSIDEKKSNEAKSSNDGRNNQQLKNGNDRKNNEEPGNDNKPENNHEPEISNNPENNNTPENNNEPGSNNRPGTKTRADDEHLPGSNNTVNHINIPAYSRTLTENLEQQKVAPEAAVSAQSEASLPVAIGMVVGQTAIKCTRIPLPDLLAELQKQTKRKIHFNSADLEKINFTGSIPFDDAIRNTLTTICRINGLTLTVKKGAYHIN